MWRRPNEDLFVRESGRVTNWQLRNLRSAYSLRGTGDHPICFYEMLLSGSSPCVSSDFLDNGQLGRYCAKLTLLIVSQEKKKSLPNYQIIKQTNL